MVWLLLVGLPQNLAAPAVSLPPIPMAVAVGVRARQRACSAQLAQGEDDRHNDSADAGHGDGATGKLGAS